MMGEEDVMLSVSIRTLALAICGLPFGAFLTCVGLAVLLHFEGATRTHCGVPNLLPSISAAIGDYTPERYIWRFCIALHLFPRYIAAALNMRFYQTSPLWQKTCTVGPYNYRILCLLVFALQSLENTCLMVLSYVSSTENKPVHETSFILFVVFQTAYMCLSLYVFGQSGRQFASSMGGQSYQKKWLAFACNVLAMLTSAYLFYRHNAYCEPGVYTMFALCEYIVVLSNIAFHATIIYDVPDKMLAVVSQTQSVCMKTT